MAVAAPYVILALGMDEGPDYIKIAAAVFSGLSLLVGLWVGFGRDFRRKRRLKRPAKAYFSGEDGQPAEKWYLPADSEGIMPLLVIPRLNYKETDFRVSFEGDPKEKPLPRGRGDRFIKEWIDEKPQNRRAGIDNKDSLHLIGALDLVSGNKYAHDIIVRTRKPGTYRVKLRSYTDSGSYKVGGELFLIVTYAKAAISPKDQS